MASRKQVQKGEKGNRPKTDGRKAPKVLRILIYKFGPDGEGAPFRIATVRILSEFSMYGERFVVHKSAGFFGPDKEPEGGYHVSHKATTFKITQWSEPTPADAIREAKAKLERFGKTAVMKAVRTAAKKAKREFAIAEQPSAKRPEPSPAKGTPKKPASRGTKNTKGRPHA